MSRAIEYRPAAERSALRVLRSGLLVSAGSIDKAIEDLNAVLEGPEQITDEERFNAAIVFARAARAAGQSDRAGDLEVRAVMELAIVAQGSFFRDPKRRTILDNHPDLKHLRPRADFKQLQEQIRRN